MNNSSNNISKFDKENIEKKLDTALENLRANIYRTKMEFIDKINSLYESLSEIYSIRESLCNHKFYPSSEYREHRTVLQCFHCGKISN